jgi:thiol-disulfide isomerase/thioredoxin
MSNPHNFVILSNSDFDNQGNLKNYTKENVVVLYYRDGCPACERFKPTYASAAEKFRNNPKTLFGIVNTSDNRSLMSRIDGNFPYDVNYVPTVVCYSNGKYYSTYDYDPENPEEAKTYRTEPDVIEYVKGIGKSKINFK